MFTGLKGYEMIRKKQSDLFDEIVTGLDGRDALMCLDGLYELQKDLFSGTTGVDSASLQKIKGKMDEQPERYRLIYKGFCQGWDLDTLNLKLAEKKEKKLYSRDLIEATLIYAFQKKLKYEKWRQLVDQIRGLEKSGAYDDLLITGSNGSYSAFPLERIERYVKDSSLSFDGAAYTIQRTRTVEQSIERIACDREFLLYITENIRNFCEGREKARYYICKYFLLYLKTMIGNYMACDSKRTLKRNIYLELPLSNISKMDPNRHARMSIDEVEECLKSAKVSSNKLFDLLNRFYFFILLGNSDANDPGWEEYSLMAKVLKGESVSRSMLLLLLLFFETEADINDEGLRLTEKRADEILKACSFELLDRDESLDEFILKALAADDRKRVIEDMIYQMDDIYLTDR